MRGDAQISGRGGLGSTLIVLVVFGLLGFVKVQQSESRRPAILVNQTAEHVPSFDWRSGSPPDLQVSVAGGYGQAQSPMWSLLYVVSNVSLEHSLEVPTTVDQDVVEALSAHGEGFRNLDSPSRWRISLRSY